MEQITQSIKLIAATITIGLLALPLSSPLITKAYADISDESNQNKSWHLAFRMEQEDKLRKQDMAYKTEADAIAKQYAETAKRVAAQGGDPKPLLEAAAYFENKAK